MDQDVIVIGAGFAGLTAAKKLQEAGKTVCVLEARDRVGGRTKPGTVAGIPIDLGGMWLGPTQTRLAALADRLGVSTYKNPLEGESVWEVDGVMSRSPGEGLDNALEPEELAEFGRLFSEIYAMSEKVDPAAPWAGDFARELDQKTVATWLNEQAENPRVRATFTALVAGVFCAEPQEMSLLWLVHYCKAAGGIAILVSAAEGGAQNFLFDGSVHSVATRLAAELGDSLRLSEPVHTVELVRDDEVVVTTPRRAYRANRAIVALPPALTERIDFEPLLPQRHSALHSRMSMGSVIKVWVAFERPYWREAGLNGMLFSDEAPFSPAFDVSPPGQGLGIISGFFDGNAAIEWSAKSEKARESCVLETIERFLGKPDCRMVDYVENDWTRERWSRGCYGAYAPPGTLTQFGECLRDPVGPLHWAGTETATEWTGYIEGAIESGERAAKEAIAALDG